MRAKPQAATTVAFPGLTAAAEDVVVSTGRGQFFKFSVALVQVRP